MSHFALKRAADDLPETWRSRVLAAIGGANLKVLRMDASPYPEETHPFPEALLVVEGRLNLVVEGASRTVGAGELFVVPAGVRHAISPGSEGTLVVIDVPDERPA